MWYWAHSEVPANEATVAFLERRLEIRKYWGRVESVDMHLHTIAHSMETNVHVKGL